MCTPKDLSWALRTQALPLLKAYLPLLRCLSPHLSLLAQHKLQTGLFLLPVWANSLQLRFGFLFCVPKFFRFFL